MYKSEEQLKVLIEEVKEIFTQYLIEKKCRRTPERYLILEMIYNLEHHFDAEQLYIILKKNNNHVSRATIYNTLDILSECKLITRHQFGNNTTYFERKYGFPPHHHFVCTNCHTIIEFTGQKEKIIVEDLIKHNDLLYNEIELNVYGLCASCK